MLQKYKLIALGGFVSTSLAKCEAEKFAESDNSGGENVIFQIKTQKNSNEGKNFCFLSQTFEEEVLFLPFCWFEVVSTQSKHSYQSEPILNNKGKVILEGA